MKTILTFACIILRLASQAFSLRSAVTALLLAPLAGMAVDETATEIVPSSTPVGVRHPDDRTDWFMQARYGVMMHFGVGPHNVALVDKFDVARLAEQLQEAGAGYFMLMLGQNSGCYAAPNAAYDEITSSSPGARWSIRDLPLELHRALHPKGIKLMLYMPANPPDVPEIRRQFGWDSQDEAGRPTPKRNRGKPTQHSLEKWCKVIREWSMRYGEKVAGWWIDGAYKQLYDKPETPDQPGIALLSAAIKAGNPAAIVAFNGGLRNRPFFYADHDDYIAGHDVGANQLSEIPESRFIGSTQWHALVYMGSNWGGSQRRFSTEQWLGYCQNVFAKGGVITFDVGKNTDPKSGNPVGTIADEHFQQLKAIKAGLQHVSPATKK